MLTLALWAAVIVPALGLAWFTGGRSFSWERARLRHGWLAVLAAVPAIVPVLLVRHVPGWLPALGTAVGVGAVLACLAWNWRSPWAVVMGLGVALNLAVIGANGGRMPVEEAAMRAAGRSYQLPQIVSCGGRHCLADASTVLRPLDDRIPVRPFGKAISAGDLVLYAGLGWWVLVAMGSRLVIGSDLGPLKEERVSEAPREVIS